MGKSGSRLELKTRYSPKFAAKHTNNRKSEKKQILTNNLGVKHQQQYHTFAVWMSVVVGLVSGKIEPVL